MQRLTQEFAFSQRHACELVEIPRSTHRYHSRKDDGALRERLLALAHEQPRYGYRRLCVLLNDGGAVVKHGLVQRVYLASDLPAEAIPTASDSAERGATGQIPIIGGQSGM